MDYVYDVNDAREWPEYDWWKYALMPFISGIVGWLTNVLALEMTFKPIEYFGVRWFRIEDQPWGFFGWQGIVPTKAAKMAETIVTLITSKLFTMEDIVKKLDPNDFYEAAKVNPFLQVMALFIYPSLLVMIARLRTV